MRLWGRNPLDILIFAESLTCKGCANEITQQIGRKTYRLCNLGRKHGHRCKRYSEQRGSGWDRQ